MGAVRVWERLGIGPVIRRVATRRRLDGGAVERVLFAWVAHRALESASTLAATSWAAERVAIERSRSHPAVTVTRVRGRNGSWCHHPDQAERDAAVRGRLVTHLGELIAGSDTWTTNRRDEFVGSLKAKPGLRRYLRRTKSGMTPTGRSCVSAGHIRFFSSHVPTSCDSGHGSGLQHGQVARRQRAVGSTQSTGTGWAVRRTRLIRVSILATSARRSSSSAGAPVSSRPWCSR